MSTHPNPAVLFKKAIVCPRSARRSERRSDPNESRASDSPVQLRTARCSEAVEQIGDRMVRSMRGDQVVARKGGPPLALTARHKDGLALFIGESIECLLDG
jgi:hypothetical protein